MTVVYPWQSKHPSHRASGTPSGREVYYVCGNCGMETRCTIPETTIHWRECAEVQSPSGKGSQDA
jgi:hypothetical protein